MNLTLELFKKLLQIWSSSAVQLKQSQFVYFVSWEETDWNHIYGPGTESKPCWIISQVCRLLIAIKATYNMHLISVLLKCPLWSKLNGSAGFSPPQSEAEKHLIWISAN